MGEANPPEGPEWRRNAELARLLQRLGLPQDVIDAWCESPVQGTSGHVAAAAAAWDAAGIWAEDAVEYVLQDAGWTPQQARGYYEAGFTPTQALFTDVLIRYNALALPSQEGSQSLPSDWLSSPLTARWICLCLAAGVPTVSEAVDLRERSEIDSEVIVGLLKRATARGIDPVSCRLPPGASGNQSTGGPQS